MTNKIRFFIPSILSTFFLLCSICLAQERAKVVFERIGPDGTKLHVLVRATRRIPTVQEKVNLAEYLKNNPQVISITGTDILYHYSLQQTTAKETRELWAFDMPGFGGDSQLNSDTLSIEVIPIQYLEIYIEADTIFSVYKAHGILNGANTMYAIAKVGDKRFPSYSDRVFTHDRFSLGFIVKSGRIEGTLQDKTLKVILDYANGAKDEIEWRNGKWVKTWDGFEKATEANRKLNEEFERRRADTLRAEEARKNDPNYQCEPQ